MSCCSNSCSGNSSASACALKDVLDSLDDLNTQDLCILRDVVERILNCRS